MTSERVAELRSITGLDMSKFAGLVGVSPRTIRRWERGGSRPHAAKVLAAVDTYFTARQTEQQQQARAQLFSTFPEGWPDIHCPRHPGFPLVLGIGTGPWCGLCLRHLQSWGTGAPGITS